MNTQQILADQTAVQIGFELGMLLLGLFTRPCGLKDEREVGLRRLFLRVAELRPNNVESSLSVDCMKERFRVTPPEGDFRHEILGIQPRSESESGRRSQLHTLTNPEKRLSDIHFPQTPMSSTSFSPLFSITL